MLPISNSFLKSLAQATYQPNSNSWQHLRPPFPHLRVRDSSTWPQGPSSTPSLGPKTLQGQDAHGQNRGANRGQVQTLSLHWGRQVAPGR